VQVAATVCTKRGEMKNGLLTVKKYSNLVCSMGFIDRKQFALGLLTVYEIQDRFALER
jgi:hypothetical protein